MIIKPKTFHKAFCVMIQGLHAMNESITTINSFAKTIRELNDEVHNDSICGA